MKRIAVAAGLTTALLLGFACGAYKPAGPTKTVTGLSMKCDATTVDAGQKTNCGVTATYSDRTVDDQTNAAEWTTSDATVATVAKGLITAVAVGTADITAKLQAVTTKTTVSVRSGPR